MAPKDHVSDLVKCWRERVLNHVGGFDTVIDALLNHFKLVLTDCEETTQCVEPSLATSTAETRARGIIIYGPHGSGKSFIASALAESCAPPMVPPQCIDVALAADSVSQPGALADLHSSLSKASNLARSAGAHAGLLVIVLEKAEALSAIPGDMTREDSGTTLDARMVVIELLMSTLRTWSEERLPVAMLVPWSAPTPVPAILIGEGKLQGSVTLPVPLGLSQRQAILHKCSERLPLGSKRLSLIDEQAWLTAGFMPCDIQSLCRAAALQAVSRVSASLRGNTGGIENVLISIEDFMEAHRKVVPASLRSMRSLTLTQTCNENQAMQGLGAVVGQQFAINALRSYVVKPFQALAAEARHTVDTPPPTGVLMVGAPGSGKTHLARMLAQELRAHVLAASPADLLTSRVGDAEKCVASLFSAARRCAPSIVILEDIDAIAPASPYLHEPSIDDEPSDEGSETCVSYVLRSEIDAIRMRRLTLFESLACGSTCSLDSEGLVFVIATTCDRSSVARWMKAPHRLSMTVELDPQLSVCDAVTLLQNFNRSLAKEDAHRVVDTLRKSGDISSSRIAATSRIAAIHAVRRAATSGGGIVCVTGVDVIAAIEDMTRTGAMDNNTWTKQPENN